MSEAAIQAEPMRIVELECDEIASVAGGILPLVLVYIASAGLITGAGIYLATEYLN